MTDINPRAVIGDNLGLDQAQVVTERLALDYSESVRNVDRLLGEANSMTDNVTSEPEALAIGGVIKRLGDLDKRLEAFREAEKQVFLRGGNAVDSFFFAQRDKLRRRPGNRSAKLGAADILQAKINIWRGKVAAAERERLDRERLEAARIAREEQAKLRQAQEEAEEAMRALGRARSAATQEARRQEMEVKAAEEARLRAAAELAAERAKEAVSATYVKTADITRVRGTDASGAGVLLTTRTEGYAVLLDRTLIDIEALREYFTDFELTKALNAWAKSRGYKEQMPGAEIGHRNVGVVR